MALDINRKYLILNLCIVFAWGLAYIFFSDLSTVTDDMGHYLYSKYVWTHPEVMLSQWQRPLYTLFTAPAAYFGYNSQRFFSLLCSLACSIVTCEIARCYGCKRTSLIPLIAFSIPAYTSIMWTNLAEPIFTAFLALCMLTHLKQKNKLTAFLISLLPLIRPEGAIIILLWGIYYAARREWCCFFLLPCGMIVWCLLSYIITLDPIYFLRSGYRFKPGLRIIQWDYFIKFHDDFCGPIWFISLVAGVMTLGLRKMDMVHVTYITIFLFFALIFYNLADIPANHFGWRFMSSNMPLVACYILVGLNNIFEARDGSGLYRKKSKRWVLLFISGIWVLVALYYKTQANAYTNELFGLAALGLSASLVFLLAPKLMKSWRMGLAIVLFSLSIGFTVHKAPFYHSSPKDTEIKMFSDWWLQDDIGQKSKKVICALSGFYYHTNLDPVENRKAFVLNTALPSGTIIIWDQWAMERWERIQSRDIEASGFKRIHLPQNYPELDIRLYQKK